MTLSRWNIDGRGGSEAAAGFDLLGTRVGISSDSGTALESLIGVAPPAATLCPYGSTVERLFVDTGSAGSGGGLYFESRGNEELLRFDRLGPGLDSVPVLIRDIPDDAALAMSLIEKIQREDLNPLEEAAGLQRLIGEFGMTNQQAADAVGRSRSAATNLLRLLHLAKPAQDMLMAGDMEMGHARALLALPKAEQGRVAKHRGGQGLVGA